MCIDEAVGTGTVDGFLNLSHHAIQTAVCARCRFEFATGWADHAPLVSTSEAWVTKGNPDWHVSSKGNLCYIYTPYWRDELRTVLAGHDIGEAAAFAASWCIYSVRWLLYRHHFAFEHGIKQWPREWPSWQHGHKAEGEYRKFKSACRKPAGATA